MQIIRDENRHYIEDAEGTVAEVSFSRAGDGALIVDSTFVRSSHRGKGLGKLLLDDVVAYARETDKKIVPLCPFAKAQFERDESYRDVMA